MRRVSYVWAAVVAGCLTATAELTLPPTPAAPLFALLTLLIAQVPLPSRRRSERPLTSRHPRSELARHLDRRARRGEAD